ncbi:MAG: M15 family metallopeptidase [Bacillota bacterium]
MSVPRDYGVPHQGTQVMHGEPHRPHRDRKRDMIKRLVRSLLVMVVLSTVAVGAVKLLGHGLPWSRMIGSAAASDLTTELPGNAAPPVAGAAAQKPAPITTTPAAKDAGPDKPSSTAPTTEPAKPPVVTAPPVETGGATVKDDDILKLVNRTHPLPASYVPGGLVAVRVRLANGTPDERLMKPEAAAALEDMMQAAEKDGVILYAVSGYRSYATQKGLYDYRVQSEGQAMADLYTAKPGQSEHQTGLAMDVAGAQRDLVESFAETSEGKWVAKNAQRFGFIIRYPQGKEKTTGYNYEPWHLRYVGVKAATEIVSKGLVLEEYLQ